MQTAGSSAVTVGERYVYIGNRADASVCAIEADSLNKGPCIKLDSTPDALICVGALKEVWATTPQSDSIAVIDALYHGLPSILGNLWRRLALPTRIDRWSLTSLQQRLVKTGGRLVKHARYYWLLLAESHLTRRLFAGMLRKIAALPVPTG
jgi:hypothetical protein